MFDAEAEKTLRRGAAIYPQPVAQACGSMLRARSEEALVDATLKAAEVLTRYSAVLGLASWAARKDVTAASPIEVDQWSGPLSFGVFLSAAERLASCAFDHPLKGQLAAGLAPKKKGKATQSGRASQALTSLLELRNELGHDVSSLTRPRAISLLREGDPIGSLMSSLQALGGLLDHPLCIFESQELKEGRIWARRVLLMGESSDPEPEEIILTSGVRYPGVPYLGMKTCALCLAPLFAWGVASETRNYRLYLIDAIEDRSLKLKALDAKPIVDSQSLAKARDCIAGASVPSEGVTRDDGVGLSEEWRQRRRRLQRHLDAADDTIPWDDLEPDTLAWYARRLDRDVDEGSERSLITSRLLDGREHLNPGERAQLVVLFGKDHAVQKRTRRLAIDLRAIGDPSSRWKERIEEGGNVIQSLKAAVGFFERHVGVDGASLDRLRETSGSADYIAMREALVNLFIHQDYTDQSAAAQVEIDPVRAVFFNPGAALVSDEGLLEGGRSQARNPLIARALRLIGFAELAGTGLREVHRVWRDLKRRPPTFKSDRVNNTFTLTLDWREVPEVYDEYWKGKIGAQLGHDEARILELAFDSAGVTVQQAASARGLSLVDAETALRTLVRQALVDEQDSCYRAKPHLRDLIPG